jgi:hypothetical protein
MIMEGKEATLSLTNRSLSLMVERQGMICGKLPKNTLSLFFINKSRCSESHVFNFLYSGLTQPQDNVRFFACVS